MFAQYGIDSELLYTVDDFQQQVRVLFSGIVVNIHQSIQSFPMYYSTVKNEFLQIRIDVFTQFPQGLLLPTERIFK